MAGRVFFAVLFIIGTAFASVSREQEVLLLGLIRDGTIVNLDTDHRTVTMKFELWHALPIKAKKKLAYFLASFCARSNKRWNEGQPAVLFIRFVDPEGQVYARWGEATGFRVSF